MLHYFNYFYCINIVRAVVGLSGESAHSLIRGPEFDPQKSASKCNGRFGQYNLSKIVL